MCAGVIGAVDGCHIKIKAPPEHHSDYLNQKMCHSVILQGICNDRKEFINAHVGSPRSA